MRELGEALSKVLCHHLQLRHLRTIPILGQTFCLQFSRCAYYSCFRVSWGEIVCLISGERGRLGEVDAPEVARVPGLRVIA